MSAANQRETPPDDVRLGATSGVQVRAVRQVRFYYSDEGALTGVEFELPPQVSLLRRVHEALQSRQVRVVDSFMRLTAETVYQRLHLSDQYGTSIVGARRQELELMFLETLAALTG